MRRRTRLLLCTLALIPSAIALPPATALSQTPEDKAAAEKLYDEGKKLLADRRFTEACKRFESSQRLDPGVGTLLFLADCYENLGRTASAWSTFREAAAAAKASGQTDRERIARDRAAKLDDKLFQLTISVAGASTPGLRVVRSDTEVKREVFGLALPVDPGTHTLSVTAPGKLSWSTTIEIPKTPGARTVEIPELEDAPAEPAPSASQSATATVAPSSTAPPPPPPGWSTGRTAGLALSVVGLAGVAVGATFGGIAAAQFSDVKTRCPNTACNDPGAVDLSKQVGTFADVSTALFVAGGAIAAAGVVLFIVSPGSGTAAKTTSWISPMVGGGAAGLRAGSTF